MLNGQLKRIKTLGDIAILALKKQKSDFRRVLAFRGEFWGYSDPVRAIRRQTLYLGKLA